MLNRVPQLHLPLSIAASILIVLALAFFSPVRLHAYNSRPMPAKAVLKRVVHRKPVPYMPFATEPKYLLCYMIETLECDHTVAVYPQADPLIARYRRCQECDRNNIIAVDVPKKPPASVKLLDMWRKIA